MEDLQQQLQQKYDEIENAILEMEKVKNETFKTSGRFYYNPTNTYSCVDITSSHSETDLINVNAFIQNKAKQYDDSAAQLGLKTYPVFKWCGYVPEDWLHDIQLRLKLMKYNDQLTALKTAKERIIPYLPQENKIKQLLLELPKISE